MAGLLSKDSQAEARAPRSSRARTDKPATKQRRKGDAPPEAQKAYETWVTRGMELMYSQQTMPALLQVIRGDGDPVEGLANALVAVVSRLEDSAAKRGVSIDADVKSQGALELVAGLAELAGPRGADIHEFKPEELLTALQQGAMRYQQRQQERAAGRAAAPGGLLS